MKEIKIRFFGHREYCQEMWEVFTEEGRPRRYLLRDSEGYGTWHYASDPDDACEPGFATQDDITLILCDKNWNEHARTGNDRTRFPAFFPTLIDACQQAWDTFTTTPDRCLDTPDFLKWLSTKMPTGLNGVEQDNWLYNSRQTIKREVLMPFDYCGDKMAIVRVSECHTLCGVTWRKYHADTLNEDASENFAHFYGYEVGNYVIGTNPLKIANLPFDTPSGEKAVSMTDDDVDAFNAKIGCHGKALCRSRDPKMKYCISLLKQEAARQNKGLTPCIDKRYYCETCGSRSGKCHPQTGYCFLCDTDNWEPVNYGILLH